MRRRLLACSYVILLLMSLLSGCAPQRDLEAANDVRLYRVLPVARKSNLTEAQGEGEAIALINAGDQAHTLSGWVVATNAGRIVLPKLTMEPGETLYLANNAAYFESYWNFSPDFEYGTDADPEVPDLKTPEGTIPLLNDYGDEVRLLDDRGNIIDILSYGEIQNPTSPWSGQAVELVHSASVPAANQVLTRRVVDGALRLDASAEAWEPALGRVYYAGQSELPVQEVHDLATFGAAPENPGPFMEELLGGAKKSIRLAGYQFSSWELGEQLIAAARRGVRVQVAVERRPGGADFTVADKWLHRNLDEAGVEVLYTYPWDGPGSQRYSAIHGNYALIDGETVVISSAPWTDDAFGAAPLCGGSRQWVVAISGSEEITDLVGEVWETDFGRPYPDLRQYDSEKDGPPALRSVPQVEGFPNPCTVEEPGVPIEDGRSEAENSGSTGALLGEENGLADTDGVNFAQRVWGSATVTRYLFPDNALDPEEGFLGILRGARRELLVSGLYMDLWWGDSVNETDGSGQINPLVTEIVGAARRGVSVRVLLDGRTAEHAEGQGSQDVVAYLNGLASQEGLDLEARLVNMEEAGIAGRYQAIGLVVDDALVIGSMNGSENSFRRARELALKVDGLAPLTRYYRERFQEVWKASQ